MLTDRPCYVSKKEQSKFACWQQHLWWHAELDKYFDDYRVVESYLAALPQRLQDVLTMRYIDNMTLAKVGDALGVTSPRARQLQWDAERRLRKMLSKAKEEQG